MCGVIAQPGAEQAPLRPIRVSIEAERSGCSRMPL